MIKNGFDVKGTFPKISAKREKINVYFTAGKKSGTYITSACMPIFINNQMKKWNDFFCVYLTKFIYTVFQTVLQKTSTCNNKY